MNYSLVKQIAEYLVINLQDSCSRVEVAGSFRRMKADCGDLEIVCIPRPGAPRPEFGQKVIYQSNLDRELNRLECEGRLGRRVKDGPKYKQIAIRTEAFGIVTLNEFNLDLFIVRPETWGVQFALRTGPAEFSKACVTARSWRGWLPDYLKIDEGQVYDTRTKTTISTPEEADFFRAIGLNWIEPSERKLEIEFIR